ncbi:DUF1801 domain-containing protein [Seohaeicola saemankumensis]|nr:DUF1801 domain-containing protein [Seohaeicola saemankumensis]MCA0871544.1 DUF1801 domain-containing protein [Seohaeicola saemankumensis]
MDKVDPQFADRAVADAFAAFPNPARAGVLRLRALIFEVAAGTPGVGRVQETLKWGQPAYLTPDTKAGSTLRLGRPKTGGYAIYAHCRTSLISDFRGLFPQFTYDGNRAVLFRDQDRPPEEQIALLIGAALTYHRKR